ncbi:MAG: xanthine dehydrogenase family protein subunit M [Candidatus Auribacterota bacterium]|nr:xanthine dehydrogenase family protein subunit M [Candidatus Auribacterota bacterium]
MQFKYTKVASVEEALELLAVGGGAAKVIAGGTDLLVNIQEGLESPPELIDIGGIAELKGIEEKDGMIELGPLVTHADVLGSELLRKKAPVLVAACSEIGAVQIRYRATIGGNIATASPSGDTVPALYALGAIVVIRGGQGEREIAIEDFFTGVKRTVLESGELIVKIRFPGMAESARSFFKKLGQRKALAIAKVSVAGYLDFQDGVVKEARIALGAVATTVIRAEKAEELLKGKKLSEEVIVEAGLLTKEASKAITDIRSNAEYRDEMAGLLMTRGLKDILKSSNL